MSKESQVKINISNAWTRGGQVSLHNLRMVKQVLWVTLLVTFVCGFSFVSIKTWTDFSPYQRYVITSSYIADALTFLPSDKTKVHQSFQDERGRKKRVKSVMIQRTEWIQNWRKNFEKKLYENFLLSLWVMVGTFLVICYFWIYKGYSKKEKEILSGPKLVKPEDLKKIIKKTGDTSSLSLGGIPLPKVTETKHILFSGTTGTGKSTAFFDLLPKIRKINQRAIIIDTTGEFVSRFYRDGQDILLNPFDQRSVGWSPWRECHSSFHYDEIAQGFIPHTGNDRFWSESARTVLSEALMYLKEEGEESVSALSHLLLNSSLKDLYETLQNTSASSLLDPAGDKTAMSIRSHLIPYIKSFRFLDETKEVFSMRDWIQEAHKDQWVFISSTPDQRETLRPLMTGLMSIAINGLMSCQPDPDRRIWFIIDELISLNKQEAIPKALAEIRKYGGCLVAGIQNISQLQEIYGYAETKSLTSLFNTKVIFRNGDPETAKLMSQMLGEQEIKESVEGISYGAHQMRDGVSLNEQKKTKPVVSPTKIMELNDLEAYLKLPGNVPISQIRFEISKLKKISPDFVPS